MFRDEDKSELLRLHFKEKQVRKKNVIKTRLWGTNQMKALLTGSAFFVQIIHLKMFFKLLNGIFYIYTYKYHRVNINNNGKRAHRLCLSALSAV